MDNYYLKIIEDMTIIKILNEIAEGTFQEGSTFEYNNKKWVYEDYSIHTVEKDYYDGSDYKSYLYLEDDIDLSNLNDKVENLMRHYKVTMSENNSISVDNDITTTSISSTLDFNQDDLDWSYNPSYGKPKIRFPQKKSVHRCPVCGGNGKVDNGFYNRTSNTWATNSTAFETCRSCCGKGYVETYD